MGRRQASPPSPPSLPPSRRDLIRATLAGASAGVLVSARSGAGRRAGMLAGEGYARARS